MTDYPLGCMRPNPYLLDEEIREAKKSVGTGGILIFDDKDRAIANRATAEALKWAVGDLRDRAKGLRGNHWYVSASNVEEIADEYEAKLK